MGGNNRISNISAIELVYSIPSQNPITGAQISIVDSIDIYYKGSDVLVREGYVYTSYNQNAMKNGVFVMSEDKSSIDLRERKYNYYLYSKGSAKGLRYDSLNIARPSQFDVDSLINKRLFGKLKLYDASNDVLVRTEKKSDGSIIDVYIPKTKFDETYNDTTYFVFNPNFKDVAYSLSKDADSLKKMKMVEARLIYNVGNPKKQFLFRLKDLVIDNPKEIEKLFDRFKKQR